MLWSKKLMIVSTNDVKASHILIRIDENETDTTSKCITNC